MPADANPSVFLYGPGNAKIEDRPEPRITEPTDAIVRIKFVGVCGSDVCYIYLNNPVLHLLLSKKVFNQFLACGL